MECRLVPCGQLQIRFARVEIEGTVPKIMEGGRYRATCMKYVYFVKKFLTFLPIPAMYI